MDPPAARQQNRNGAARALRDQPSTGVADDPVPSAASLLAWMAADETGAIRDVNDGRGQPATTKHSTDQPKGTDMAVKFGILALLEAKNDKGPDLQAFLESGRAIAAAEEGTVTWYAFRIGDTTFGIFDTFETEDARGAHLNGQIPEALAQVAPTCSRRIPTSARSTSSRSSSRSRRPVAIRRRVRASAAAWLGTSRR